MAQSSVMTQWSKRFKNSTGVYETHGKAMAVELDKKLTEAKGEKSEAAALLLGGTFVLCKKAVEQAEKSDALVVREAGESQKAMDQRDQQIAASRAGAIRLKNSLDGIYGPGLLNDLGLSGPTPEDSSALLQSLSNTLDTLSQWNELPKPLDYEEGDDAGVVPAWTLKGLQARITKLTGPLHDALAKVVTESKEDEEAQIKRRQDLEEVRRQVITFDALLEAFARSTHNDEVARRIRPAGRTRQTPSEEPSGAQSNTPPTDPNVAPSP